MSVIARQAGIENAIAFDMGGTTARGALGRDGRARRKYELEVARVHEFKAGSGLPAKAPVMEISFLAITPPNFFTTKTRRHKVTQRKSIFMPWLCQVIRKIISL